MSRPAVDPCVFCGAEAMGRRGWCTPVTIGPHPTFVEAVLGAEHVAVVLRTCLPCVNLARRLQREEAVIGMYTPARPPA